MFEFLETLTADECLSAIYFAVRLISHRHEIGDYRKARPVQGVNSEPTETEADLGKRIGAEIVRRTGKGLQSLPQEDASRYISDLARLAQSRANGELPNGRASGRGEKILKRWRAEAVGRRTGTANR